MSTRALTLIVVLLSAGCGSKASVEGLGNASASSSPLSSAAFAMTLPPPTGVGAGGVASSGRSAAAGPSQPVDPLSYLAYAYGISVELPGDRLIGVMEGHAAACRSAGLRVCQLVASRREGDPQETLRGSLSLRAEPSGCRGS